MAGYLVSGFEHPDHLPGEPRRERAPWWIFAPWLVARAVGVAVAGLLVAPLWAPLLVGAAVWGHPPTAARARDGARVLRRLWRRRPGPGVATLDRLSLTVTIARMVALAPLPGLAWLVDELLYGRALSAVRVRAPIFLVSAARSGSTQLAHELENDPRVVAPTMLQILWPYLWLWRLAAPTLGRLLGRARVRAIFRRLMPPEFLERHEGDPYRTDTFELAFYRLHPARFAAYLGPDVFPEEFVIVDGPPGSAAPWRGVIAPLVVRMAHKTLLFAGAGDEARLFVKGHFLGAADALAAAFPDARFVTMLRAPAKRLQSMVNFLWCNPIADGIGKPPWAWLAAGVAAGELAYNEAERAWFTRPDGPRRVVLRFDAYVRDLPGTLARIHAACFDAPPPGGLPSGHGERARSRYAVDRSLAALGVDAAAYEAAQPAFVAWCRGDEGREG
ncbi:MAG: sulfotransferase [bacterium]|nr:sulfotransferase [Myxococcales bacterium]MCB9554187.1 sulfotransferase [Myxococcales bacterium]